MAKRRNLLFLFTDEQRADTMRAYGNMAIDSPHLDALARDAVVFEKCYVTQPVCTPSRATIMTGRYPHTIDCTCNNVPLRPDVPCIPEMVNGYRTAYFGKWHLGDEIFAQHGFEHWVSVEDMYKSHYAPERDRNARSTYHHWLEERGYTAARTRGDSPGEFGRGLTARFPEAHCKPAYLAHEVGNWLERLDADEPFVAYVNFLEPHMPYTGPRDAQYALEDVVLPPNFDHVPDERNHLKSRLLEHVYRGGFDGFALDTETDWRRITANYWGLVSQVDAALGTILEALRANGRDEETIIVFTSDHGDMMGSHRLLAKTVMWEEAVTVPLLIRTPGVSPRTERQIVSQVDLVPTLLELLGVDASASFDGQSLAPLIERGEAPAERDVFIQWTGPDSGVGRVGEDPRLAQLGSPDRLLQAIHDPVRSVVTADRWKLNFSPDLGQHELFDLNQDPHEMDNRYGRPECVERFEDLRSRIRTWGKAHSDPVAAGI